MLVLTRKFGEKVYITTPEGKKIALTICGIQGFGKNGRVKLGIDADRDYIIAREELIDRQEESDNKLDDDDDMLFNNS